MNMNKKLNLLVSTTIGGVIGGVAATGIVAKSLKESTARVQKMSDKHLELFKIMNQWVRIKQEGKNLSSYFEENGYKKIAIYGMSYVGETLVNELKETNIQVLYGIDQNADNLYAEVDVISLEDNLEAVDAIVVTAITFFEEIEEKLNQLIDCPIISLEDILYDF